MLKLLKHLTILSFCTYLVGCGTDTSSGNQGTSFDGTPTPGVTVTTSGGTASSRSRFSLRLTDAPVDDLTKVVVQFTAVEMRRISGGWTKYTLPAPLPIDLLSLQGLTTADLLVHMPIEPGDYNQVRFIVDDSPMANIVERTDGGVKDLSIPNGSTIGLRVRQNFTIPDDRLVNFTVDFDLRKAVKYNSRLDQFRLRSKMRFVVDNNVGFIRGTVDPSLLLAPSCFDNDVDTHNAVYVYAGHDAVPDDILIDDDDSVEDDAAALSTAGALVTTTPIRYDSVSGNYVYEAAFLPQGNYTIAFTCNSILENLESGDDDLNFFVVQNANVLVTDIIFLRR